MPAPKGNKFALGNNGGRPAKYETPKELEAKIIEYFTYIEENKAKLTVTGLSLFLGFADKSSLKDYIEKKEFSHLIKRAKLVIEDNYEQNLTENNATGSIFALKNMGWTDKREHDINAKVESTSITPEERQAKIDAIIKKAQKK